MEKDPINGLLMIKYLAMIAAWVGEKDLACEQLVTVIRYPFGGLVSYGELKLKPNGIPRAANRASKKSSPPSRRKNVVNR